MSVPPSPIHPRTPARSGAGGIPGTPASVLGSPAGRASEAGGLGAAAERGARMERLELFNFKSYDGQHSVPFTQFTAVIGPNGSGKSNLLDALAFVLGVRLEKERARAHALTDFLHKKQDETLEEVEAAGRGTAYVELVHMSAEGIESKFRRTVTSKGTSRYSVDGRTMEYGLYKAQLEEVAITVDAKNFLVFQGDVEGIASKSPRELSELLEKISGSARLKHAYDEAKEAVEKSEETFTLSFEQKRFVVKERSQLKAQKEEAEQYQHILAQQQASKVNLTLFQLFYLQLDIDNKIKEAAAQAKDLASRRAALSTLESSVQSVAAETARLRKETAITDKHLAKASASLDKKRPQQASLRQEITHLTKSMATEKKKLETATADAQAHAAETKKLGKELESVQAQLAELQAALEAEDEESKKLQLASAQRAEYNELKQRAALETAELTARIKAAQSEARSVGESAEAVRLMLASIEERVEVMEKTQKEVQARHEKNLEVVRDTKAQLAENKKELSTMRDRAEKARARKAALESELRVVKDQLGDAKSDRHARESDARLHDTLDTLKSHFTGVRGTLAELSSVLNPKYALALSIAFGRHLDSVVVNDQATGMEAINYLREQRLRPITFIPLDTIKVKPLAESMRALKDKGFPLAIELINFDEDLTKAFLYALGDTLICDTDRGEDAAIQKSQALTSGGRGGEQTKYKVVTLGGTMLHRSGNLTGGASAKGDRSGKLRTASDKVTASKQAISEKELQKLSERSEALIKQLIEMEGEQISEHRQRDEEAAIVSKILGLEGRLKYAEQDVVAASKKLTDNDKKLKDMHAELKKSRPALEQLQKELDEKHEAIGALESDLGKREEKLFRDFSRKVGVSNIREFENERLKLAEQYHTEQANLKSQENNLKNQLDYERNRDLQSPIDKHKKKIAEIEAKIKAKKKEDAALEAELAEERAKVDELIAKAGEINKEMDAKQTQLKQAKKQLSDLEHTVQSLDKSVSLIRSQIMTLKLSRHEVLRQSVVEDLELPELAPESDASKRKKKRQKRGAADEERDEDEEEEERKSDAEMGDAEADAAGEVAAVDASELAAEARRRFDYSDLDEEYLNPAASPAQREAWRQEFLKVLAQHQETLDSLAPNLKAIDKFAEVSSAFQNTKAEWEEKKRAAKKASEAFEVIKEQRQKLFMQAYEHISRAIAATYTQLTASREFPVGGKAYLSLDSNEEPYLHGIKYTAMPPMKRFRAMNELSGGEKTVAALAMLFAIHSFRPAPFFVLDEIDAALDNINVNRVANYIRARCHRDGLQVVVISLKDSFYNKADALVGVYKDQEKQSSAHLTIDLLKYPA